MKKIALSLVALSALAFANPFVGIEGRYDHQKLKDEIKDSIKDGVFGLGIKGGYDFGMFRVYGSYAYDLKAKDEAIDKEGTNVWKWTRHEFLANADYTPSLSDDFKLIVGAYTGLALAHLKASDGRDDTSSGWVLGARLGGEYSLDDHNAIEFGVKGDYTKYKENVIDGLKGTGFGAYLGYTYKF